MANVRLLLPHRPCKERNIAIIKLSVCQSVRLSVCNVDVIVYLFSTLPYHRPWFNLHSGGCIGPHVDVILHALSVAASSLAFSQLVSISFRSHMMMSIQFFLGRPGFLL